MKKEEIIKRLDAYKPQRGIWHQGIKDYAYELLEVLNNDRYKDEDFSFSNSSYLEEVLLNGAQSWYEYSWGGCSLIYNSDIAERLAPLSQRKAKPNRNEEWLDVQARALCQAFCLIRRLMYEK